MADPSDTDALVDDEPEIDQPELSKLREVVANHFPALPRVASLRRDGVAGLTGALVNVPEGMAAGLLAGVNPIYGLYACMAAPIAGGLFSSTQLMVISTTTTTALMAGQSLAGMPMEDRGNALFTMVLLIGAFQVVFGLLGAGRLTRFVSFSVMTGFIAGIAVVTILAQLPVITGYEATGANRVAETIDLLQHLEQVEPWSLVLAVFTLGLVVILPRTRLGNAGTLVAIAVPSILAVLLQLTSVEVVRDVGKIPRGIPAPFLPSLSYVTADVVTGALAISIIVLVQAAGVSQSVPNPDGSPRRLSRDFVAHGAANLASGFLRGLPVGGSIRTTALTIMAGAGSRWASVFAGLWMAAILLIFVDLVSYIAMPALGALLIFAGAGMIKMRNVATIWSVGWPSIMAGGTTFIAILFLPIQAAVAIGAALSALLYTYVSSNEVSVVELVKREDGLIEERRPDQRLASHEVTVLDIYGHLFFAGARTLERQLPDPGRAQAPVVILRLRGRNRIRATLIDVLEGYAEKLNKVGGRIYLSGVSEEAHGRVTRSGKLTLSGPVRVYEMTPVVGESTRQAYTDAEAWLVEHNSEGAE